jgi:hypothetical protein
MLLMLFQSGLSIPVSRMLESEADKLTRMEDVLTKRIVGQDEAVKKLPIPSSDHAPVFQIQIVRLAHLSSLVLLELVKQNLPKL